MYAFPTRYFSVIISLWIRTYSHKRVTSQKIWYNGYMEISKKQFEKIKNLMPIERKPAKISSKQFLNALLYIVENGWKWRSLLEKFGKWHTIYIKFNRLSKNGTIQRIFEELQSQNIIDVQSKILCLDSTSVKVHPDAADTRNSSGEQSLTKKLEIWRDLFACETSLYSCRIWARHACRGSRPKGD